MGEAAVKAKGSTKKAGAAEAPVKKKAKLEAVPPPKLTPAQQLAIHLKGQHGDDYADCVMDADAPIKEARDWLPMAAWWNELTDTIGVPFGHPIVVQGKPDVGKTTLAMEAMIAGQQKGAMVVLVNTERKFNKKRFVRMGGDLTQLVEIIADTIEEAYDKLQVTILNTFGGYRTIRSAGGKKVVEEYEAMFPGSQMVIVWDSLGQTPTEAENESDAYDQSPATAARAVRRNVRKITKHIAGNDIAMIYVNHVYSKLNVKYGDGTAGYGGSGAYYASVFVIEVEKIGSFKRTRKGRTFKYLRVRLKLKKNHLSDFQGSEVVVNLMPNGIQQKVAKDGDDDRDHDGPVPRSLKKKAKREVEDLGDDDLG